MKIIIKNFQQLTKDELYAILQLRSEVFVVEQNCIYQDIDAKDQKALHVLGLKDNVLVAYARLFKAGDYFESASIGRVVVCQNERQHRYGYDIINASIEAIKHHFNETTIKISAQEYLKKFYTSLGFVTIGTSYLEDGIPHVAMVRN